MTGTTQPPAHWVTPECWCESCDTAANAGFRSRMNLCPICGNKRCPRATHHDQECTGSNAPGQKGSSWERVRPADDLERDRADEAAAMYGFFHTTCIHESAAALVSLHRTKRGAWKAMHKHQWDGWEAARSPEQTNLHLGQDRDMRRWLRDYRNEMRSTRSHVAAVEVHP